MNIETFVFGLIQIDGTKYEHDIVIDRGKISKRRKKASKKLRSSYGHTPLSLEEDIPWKCQRLVVGTGASGAMPVVRELQLEANKRNIELVILPTGEAIDLLQQIADGTNAVLHVTC
jgi:hypothetical protein